MKKNILGLAAALIILSGFAIGFGYLSQRIVSDFSGQIALGCLTFLGGVWLASGTFENRVRRRPRAG